MDPRKQSKTLRSPETSKSSSHRQQLPSLLLFLGAIILLNLCPFQEHFRATEHEPTSNPTSVTTTTTTTSRNDRSTGFFSPQVYSLEACANFVKLMFTNPLRLERSTTRFSMADAKVIGKMVKVLYIKKKIKKLGKKLKKHTIAVPVFTAIPVYEQPYFPQPPIAHLPHPAAIHHAAAASAFIPTVTQLTTTMNPLAAPLLAANQMAASQVAVANHAAVNQAVMNTAASNTHQQVTPYQRMPHQNNHHSVGPTQPGNIFHPAHLAAAQQIINHYAPSAPIFVDETGGLYGTYGNAYGRYDGGYHIW